ncbi:MAG: bifunctional 2-C-methyl-D-erythritol 4-phosphate cytidylyltransferase/2-C-methyl-D-erythritol 2,4-cyclodiphosphate synthase [Robiginitomaculum sp.]|nr:bifunctional 2-C-methyl-D-erythritol 4-phosphate cytidylyltransferase/2-C-methyl-D-erythritol 2,4-cyclodiphosphate synthase [Robiginitomaculum sp.]
MKTDVVIVAAGSSTRFGGEIPKQYCKLYGQAILKRTYDLFAKSPLIRKVIVVIAKTDLELLKQAFNGSNPDFVYGGATRSQSVLAGLQSLQNEPPNKVLIHDAARPFINEGTISAIITMLDQVQGCAPALPIVDAIKYVDAISGEITSDADRNQILRMQTPQGFCYSSLMKSYDQLANEDDIHDDLTLALRSGMICKTIPGLPDNFKITTKSDLQRAERNMVQKVTFSVTGTGYDVHQICDGTGMFLCGVHIPGNISLKGHSDADVGLHAITDGLLGAMALGDIGDHFPPSEEKWKNASSDIFLSHAKYLTNENSATIAHVDVTLICEAPKIKPYREQMRKQIAKILEIDLSAVSVKATTTESLGFTGRGEGIAAMASVTVIKETE